MYVHTIQEKVGAWNCSFVYMQRMQRPHPTEFIFQLKIGNLFLVKFKWFFDCAAATINSATVCKCTAIYLVSVIDLQSVFTVNTRKILLLGNSNL